MAKFDRMGAHRDRDLVFHIRSANDDGTSRLASKIVVPNRSHILNPPEQIKKLLHDRVYHLSWKPATVDVDIQSYTVFWCATKNEFLNQCDVSDLHGPHFVRKSLIKFFAFSVSSGFSELSTS